MNKTVKLVLSIALTAVFFGAVYFAYTTLSEDYAPDVFEEPETTDSVNGDDGEREPIAAPDFTVLNEAGEEVKLSDYFGKPIVLNFWATWCYYCKEEMPDFDKAYKEHPEVQFLMVNATDGVRETIDIAKKYIEDQGYEFPVVFDTKQEAVYAYYITGYPTTWLIDKDGNLVTCANGMLTYDNLIEGIELLTK